MPTSAPWASAGAGFLACPAPAPLHEPHLPVFIPPLCLTSWDRCAQECLPRLLQSLSLLMAHEVDGPLIYKASRRASRGGLCRAFSQSWATEAAP